jgi:hypothetical protein
MSSGAAYSSGRWLYPLRQGNEQHRETGAMRPMKQRVVIGAADHREKELNVWCLRQACRERVDDRWPHSRAGASAFTIAPSSDRYAPLCRYSNRIAGGLQSYCMTAVAPSQVGVAEVDAEANPAGHAVDGAGKYVADANGRHGVDCVPLVRAAFSIARIISAAAHRASRRSGIKHTAGVSAGALQ